MQWWWWWRLWWWQVLVHPFFLAWLQEWLCVEWTSSTLARVSEMWQALQWKSPFHVENTPPRYLEVHWLSTVSTHHHQQQTQWRSNPIFSNGSSVQTLSFPIVVAFKPMFSNGIVQTHVFQWCSNPSFKTVGLEMTQTERERERFCMSWVKNATNLERHVCCLLNKKTQQVGGWVPNFGGGKREWMGTYCNDWNPCRQFCIGEGGDTY